VAKLAPELAAKKRLLMQPEWLGLHMQMVKQLVPWKMMKCQLLTQE